MRFLNLFSIHSQIHSHYTIPSSLSARSVAILAMPLVHFLPAISSDSVERDNESSDGSFNGPATKIESTRGEILFGFECGTIDGRAIAGIEDLSSTSDVELSMPVALLFGGRMI